MKKQTGRISKQAVRLITSILISIFFCSASTFAQTESPNAQKSDVWEVHYWVSVKGNFKHEPELGSDGPTLFFKIRRNYEGASKLVFAPRPDDPQAARLHPSFKDPSTKVHITINDSRTAAYEPLCGEVLRVEETWKAEVFSSMGDQKYSFPALLFINNENLSYKTSFPILYLPRTNSNEIEHTKTEIVNEYSGEDKVQKVYPVEYQSLITHGYPSVKGFIEKTSIIRAPSWSELKWDNASNIYSWSSEVLHPDEPLIRDIPESKDEVDIVISYNLIRVKG